MSTRFRFPNELEFRNQICWAPIARSHWGQPVDYLDVKHSNNSTKYDWQRYLQEFSELFPEVSILEKTSQCVTVRFEDIEDGKDWNQTYGLGVLLRYIEEQPPCVEQYIRLRDFMPPDAAFLLANTGPNFTLFHAHAFTGNLRSLYTLKDFSIRKAFLDNCTSADRMTTTQVLTRARPWFGTANYYPSNWCMTPEIYELLNTDKPDSSTVLGLISAEKNNYTAIQ